MIEPTKIDQCKIEFQDDTLYDRVQKCCFGHGVFWRTDKNKEGKYFSYCQCLFIHSPVMTTCFSALTFDVVSLPQISPEDFLTKYEQVEKSQEAQQIESIGEIFYERVKRFMRPRPKL